MSIARQLIKFSYQFISHFEFTTKSTGITLAAYLTVKWIDNDHNSPYRVRRGLRQ